MLGGPDEPWHDPLARWALGALLERACSATHTQSKPSAHPVTASAGGSAAAEGGASAADALRWAARFATDSFGDALLAAALASLLRPAVAPGVQVIAPHCK